MASAITTLQQLLSYSAVTLRSWKGDFLHRPDSPQGVTTWNTGIGNVWTPVAGANGTVQLRSWKGDFLHRPDSPQGVTTWNTGIGNDWTPIFGANGTVELRSWEGDFLHRPDSPQGVTTWNTGIGNVWTVEPAPITVTFNKNFPKNNVAMPYVEAGLTFTNNTGNQWSSPYKDGFVSNRGVPSQVTVNPAQGKTFELKSLQIRNINTAIPEQAIVFDGIRDDGSKISANFKTPGNNEAPQTFAPSGFSRLTSLTVRIGFVAFDNLVFFG
jgi:hypothetical protein